MPSIYTAEVIVREVRDHLQIFDNPTLSDGFPDDDPDPDTGQPYNNTKIINWVNVALANIIAESGIAKCYDTFTCVIGQAEYMFTQDVNEIVFATVSGGGAGNNIPLYKTTQGVLNRNFAGWQDLTNSNNTGVPTQYYTYSDVIGLYPAPDQAYTVQFLTDALTSDLVTRDNIPGRIPGRHHSIIAMRTALLINNMVEIENPISQKRIQILQDGYTDGLEKIREMVYTRSDDETPQVTVMDYRSQWRSG